MLLVLGLVRTRLGRNCHVKLDFATKKWRCGPDTDFRGGWPAGLRLSTDGTFELKDNGVIWLWDGADQQRRNTLILRDAPTSETDKAHDSGTARFFDPPSADLKDVVFPWIVAVEPPADAAPQFRMVIVDRGAPADAGFGKWLKSLDTALLGAQLSMSSDWVSGVSEMSSRLYVRTRKDKLTELFIFGHATPGFQSLGAGNGGVDASGLHSVALDPQTGHLHATTAMYLRGMRSYFHPSAVVTLGGCQVAGMTDIVEGEKSTEEILAEARRLGVPVSRIDRAGKKIPGTRLLQEVSEALGGIWVQGADANQRYLIPGMAGHVYRCNPQQCIDMGTGWWSVPGATDKPHDH